MPLQDQATLHKGAAILLSNHKKRCCARIIRCAPSKSAATAHRLAPERKCGTSPPLQLALKEWAVTCAALAGGDQTVCVQCRPQSAAGLHWKGMQHCDKSFGSSRLLLAV